MAPRNQNPEGGKQYSADYYDLSKEASKRPGINGGAEQARQLESDDLNEETTQGSISLPSGDSWGENKVSTSLDDE